MSEIKNRTEPNDISDRSGLSKYFHDLLDIRDDMMTYEEIDRMMHENTVIHGANMWILMLAVFIASIGLNVNSTAVIIGAMLISPLMSGIMTMGYSLAVRDIDLLLRAMKRFGTQVAISLIASTLYFLITPLNSPTPEMIARTSPTLWDVLIALFGGIAGMIGNTRQKKGNVIPGVAIATALMPPLCTAGYGIATLQPKFFGGAFYLFIINTMFIALSTAFVTVVLHVPRHRHISPVKQKRINTAVAIITVLTVIPSVYIGAVTVFDSYRDRNINSFLKNEFVFQNSQVVKSSADNTEKVISVSLVGENITEEKIGSIESTLSSYGLGDYKLKVTQNFIDLSLPETDETDADKLTIAIQEHTIAELQSRLDENELSYSELERKLSQYKVENERYSSIDTLIDRCESVFTYLSDLRCGVVTDGDIKYVLLMGETEKRLSAEEIAVIENYIISESGFPMAHAELKFVPVVSSVTENENAENDSSGEASSDDENEAAAQGEAAVTEPFEGIVP